MRWMRSIRGLLLVLEMLLKREVRHMLLYMVMEVVRKGRVGMVVAKVVLNRGMPHWVVVEVMVMVRGRKRHDRHR